MFGGVLSLRRAAGQPACLSALVLGDNDADVVNFFRAVHFSEQLEEVRLRTSLLPFSSFRRMNEKRWFVIVPFFSAERLLGNRTRSLASLCRDVRCLWVFVYFCVPLCRVFASENGLVVYVREMRISLLLFCAERYFSLPPN